MKMAHLWSWRDAATRDAVEQMALDEALFRLASERRIAISRFYTWSESAVTEGYFAARRRSADPAEKSPSPIRRLTGGGRVEHGEDLTFLLAVPEGEPLSGAPGGLRYRWIHEALAAALHGTDLAPALHPESAGPAPIGPCFVNPVPWDLVDARSGEKIGGGAQRRSRGALIHQGSLRLPPALRHPDAAWIERFLARLAESNSPLPPELQAEAAAAATPLATTLYGSETWNRPS